MSDNPPSKVNPFDKLTPEQRERGRKLFSEVSVGKITVSFSIEDRDPEGRKKSSFYSVSASRGVGEGIPAGYSMDETKVVRMFLARHVVQSTYDDAFRRKVLPHSQENIRERDEVLASYDEKLAHLLSVELPK